MNDIGNQIIKLIKIKGQNAAQLTHAVSFIGNGNMHTGIERIAKFFRSKGIIEGSLGTLSIVGIILAIKQLIKSGKVNKEGQEILSGLDEILTSENNRIVEKTVIKVNGSSDALENLLRIANEEGIKYDNAIGADGKRDYYIKFYENEKSVLEILNKHNYSNYEIIER